MRRSFVQQRIIELACVALLSSCSTMSPVVSLMRTPDDAPVATEAVVEETQTDEELTQFLGLMRHDLAAYRARERARNAVFPPTQASGSRTNGAAPTSLPSTSHERISFIRMPVVGVSTDDITNSWGDPRDGGRRRHRGIDIFAPKGTPLVAVADGYLSYIGNQPKGGLCLWLTSNDGMSFYYAHLDRWAPGIYEGMEVRAGDLLGYVGNTGNAARTASHLHFSVIDNEEAINPYNVLKYGRANAQASLSGGFSRASSK